MSSLLSSALFCVYFKFKKVKKKYNFKNKHLKNKLKTSVTEKVNQNKFLFTALPD